MSNIDWSKLITKPMKDAAANADLKCSALVQRDALLAAANQATTGMSDAYITGLLNAADTATFKSYAAYKLALGKIDTQVGFPHTIDWPVVPT